MSRRGRVPDELASLSKDQLADLHAAFDTAARSDDGGGPPRKRARVEEEPEAAGGFIVDDQEAETAPGTTQEEDERRITMDQVPTALELLDLDVDADVLDVFRDATDDDDTVSRDDFLRVCAILITQRDEGGTEEEEYEEEQQEVEEAKPSAKAKGKRRAVSPPAKKRTSEGKAKKPKKDKGALTEDRLALIDKLFTSFTSDAVGAKKQSIGIDGVRAVAQLVGNISWNDGEIQEMLDYASKTADKRVDRAAFQELALRCKAV